MGSPNKIGDIQPYAELHQGATTTVYKGFQKSLDRFVLLKILHPQFSRDEEVAARFEEEARLAAKIQHPNVVSVYGYGREDGRAYIAAEFIEGITLAELIEKGPLPANIASYVLIEATNALKAAHGKQVLHRDIKPSNILISNDGHVKVTDFGMASVGSTSGKENLEVRGTLAYLAPEQILGKKPEESSDLFSLGATFFEMLLGTPAFKGSTSRELLDSVLNHDPVSYLQDDDSIPSQLRRICQQLIKKKAEQRYQNCSVLLSDLNAFRKSRGQGAVATSVDMKSYLADPEAFVKKMRDKPVSLRTREAKPREDRPLTRERKATPAKKAKTGFNMGRLFSIVAIVVLLFGGLSFASEFLFSKDGDFGARKNPNGSPGPSTPTTGTVIAKKGGSPSGKGIPVDSDRESQQIPPPVMPPVVQPALQVAVIDESLGRDIGELDSVAVSPKPEDTAIDTVILTADTDQRTGTVLVDALPWAAVFLKGDSLGVTPLPIVISPGTHKITLKNPDFPTTETLIDVVPGRQTSTKISLWLLVGTVEVEVFPYAKVFIDGEFRDETPLDRPLIVKPGLHEIRLEHPTLGTLEETFEVAAGERNKLLKYVIKM